MVDRTASEASEPGYLVANRANWDDRAVIHATSPDYEVRAFVEEPQFLSNVVRFDRPRLGDVRGLDAVHLQCHIGTDTISVARLGARMTGLDLSPQSVAEAQALATAAGADIDYWSRTSTTRRPPWAGAPSTSST